MKPQLWFVCGALLSALGVVNGAFGAHYLPTRLPDLYADVPTEKLPLGGISRLLEKRYADYDTGVRYQMYHAFGLMLLGVVASQRKSALWSVVGFCFFFGTLLFSGCLYALVLTNQTILGAIVPIGGVLFIVGWLTLAIAVYKQTTATAGTGA
ncbi:MAG: DUF423 domain-containing protein [Planctomycetia bacterium]|nr:DUF423 domain-containing protein [Planctomycetia bacterium]